MSAETASRPGNDGRPATSTHDGPDLDIPETTHSNVSESAIDHNRSGEGAGAGTGKGPVNGTTNGEGGSTPVAEPPFLQPSEFYPLSNHTGKVTLPPPRLDGFLSPEDDKLAMRGIPIFRPTLEEFADFEGYVTKTVPWGQYSGIVKIIPPAEWTHSLPPIPAQALADIRIRSPIQQNMLGQAGLFRATNVEKNKNRPLSVKEWFDKSRHSKFQGPGPKDVDMTLDRDSAAVRSRRAEEEKERKKKKDILREKRKAALARKAERLAQQKAGEEGKVETRPDEVELDNDHESVIVDEPVKEETNHPNGAVDEPPVPPLDPSSHHSPQSSADDSAKTPESNHIDPLDHVASSEALETDTLGSKRDAWYDQFDPATTWLPKDTLPGDYTPEACANLERKFWKTMGLGEPSWYGADLQGTLFPDPNTPWNVAHLPNLLNRLGRELPGVNRPYLYFGMWRAAFAWHVEDMDLFSINYIHFGAPKFWYAIPQGQAEQFERTITSYFPREATQCDQFLRHKAYIMSPTRLAKDGIHVNMLVHNQGEFVITYPRGYHAGWNMGFNCAESVNFALDSWVELGRRAKVCKCVSHSVRIDMNELLGETRAREQQEEKMRTENELIEAFEAERAKGPKRPRASHADRPRKRTKVDPDADSTADAIMSSPAEMPDGRSMPVAGMDKKRKTISLEKKPPRPPAISRAAVAYPCVLCVNTSTEGLLDVFEPNDQVKQWSKSADGVVRAHEICANTIPETWVSELEGGIGLKSVVAGVNEIGKARWGLKCQSCTDKKLAGIGAKIQCVKGKCPRAFHVTCARDDEQVVYRVWEVEELVEPAEGADGAEPTKEKVQKIECLCPTHNPDIQEAKKAKAARELRDRVLAVLPGESVKIKSSRGLFEVKMVRVLENEQTAEVQHENGQNSLVKWTDFDFRPTVVHKPAENEYAREYATTRNEDGKIVQLTPSTSNATAGPSKTSSRAPVPVQHRQPLSVNQLLNHPPPPQPHQPIPSRVVVCDSGYRAPPAVQYAQPPPAFLTHGSYPIHHPPYGHGHGYPPASSPSAFGYGYGPSPDVGQMPVGIPGYGGRGYPPYPMIAHDPLMPAPFDRHRSSQHPQYLTEPPSNRVPPSAQGYPAMQPMPPPAYHYAHPYPSPVVPSASQTFVPRPSITPSSSHQSYSSLHDSSGHGTTSSGHSSHHPTPSRKSSSGSRFPPENASREAHRPNGGSGAQGVGKIDLGLQRMQALMDLLTPLRIPAIHLAGTNGKGSVSAFLESALRAAGLRVARYNSPHLIEPRDAIALDGMAPPLADYTFATERVSNLSIEKGINATTFEIATAAAYELISAFKPDVMIIECGMGGMGDATNVIPPDFVLATALTTVGLDHTAFLGETIEEITAVKAGIAVPGGIAVIGPQIYNGVARIARRIAEDQGARVILADRATVLDGAKATLDLRSATHLPKRHIRVSRDDGNGAFDTDLGLAGEHQLDNVAVAVNILSSVRQDPRARQLVPKLVNLTDAMIGSGIASTTWKGRCEFHRLADPANPTAIGMGVLVDGAHNADSATALRRFVDDLTILPRKKITWIISLSDSKGKTPESVLQPLLSSGDRVFVTGFSPVAGMPWVRPVSLGVLGDTVKAIAGVEPFQRDGVADVIEEVRGWTDEERGLVIVAGSLYGVADFYRLL